jgi:hypothetical protein
VNECQFHTRCEELSMAESHAVLNVCAPISVFHVFHVFPAEFVCRLSLAFLTI